MNAEFWTKEINGFHLQKWGWKNIKVLKEIPEFMEIAEIQEELEETDGEISNFVRMIRKTNDEKI